MANEAIFLSFQVLITMRTSEVTIIVIRCSTLIQHVIRANSCCAFWLCSGVLFDFQFVTTWLFYLDLYCQFLLQFYIWFIKSLFRLKHSQNVSKRCACSCINLTVLGSEIILLRTRVWLIIHLRYVNAHCFISSGYNFAKLWSNLGNFECGFSRRNIFFSIILSFDNDHSVENPFLFLSALRLINDSGS